MEEEVVKFIPCLVLSCLQHTDNHLSFQKELSNTLESLMFESISDSAMHFYVAYDAEYRRIIEKVFQDPQFMKSKHRFLATIAIRCLKLCNEPTFFNFLLMCAFVGRIISFCYSNGKCYRVAENAWKCAIAVFKRKFSEFFKEEGGLTGLWNYSDCLNETVLDQQDSYEDLKDILTPHIEEKQRVLSLLNDCENVDFTEYILTDFEIKLLYKNPKNKLRKLKPGHDCLLRRIPRKYFEIQWQQNFKNVMNQGTDFDFVDMESSQRKDYSLRDVNSSSNSTISEILPCSSPINYNLTKDPGSSRIRTISLNTLEMESSPEKDAVSITKRQKISNLSKNKLFLETYFHSSQKQSLPFNLDSSEKPLSLPMRVSSFEDKLSKVNKCPLHMQAETSKKPLNESRIVSDEEETSLPTTDYIQLQFGPEALTSLPTSPSIYSYSTQDKSPSEFHQGKSSLTPTQSQVIPASYRDRRQNQISECSPFSGHSTSNLNISSEGYFTNVSYVSDSSSNEESQSDPSSFYSSLLTSSDGSSEEEEYFDIDWQEDTTLKSFTNHKCFHCGKKCFNYVIYVFQNFINRFKD